jgi:DNA-directed RNA polymerase specialized sigma24 family protein
LDDDRERAALAYEQLRHRLIGLLRWWGAPQCEELADRALDRVARKLEDGVVIARGSLGAYLRGVAKMVHYEAAREEGAHRDAQRSLGAMATAPESRDVERRLSCLDQALAGLSDQERELVLRYYGDGKKEDIRRELAQQFGLSATALRIRTCRLRDRLERAVSACLARPAERGKTTLP